MKNLLLITIDCLRHDAVNETTTPEIMNLSKNGLFFKRAYSLGSWTAPSITGMLTSTYPLMYGGLLRIKYPRISLAQVLKNAGYSTGGFVFHPYLSKYYGYSKGFDTYLDSIENFTHEDKVSHPTPVTMRKQRLKSLVTSMKTIIKRNKLTKKFAIRMHLRNLANKIRSGYMFYLPADRINEILLSWIDQVNEPFFAWVHYLDTHFPYLPKSWDIDEIIRLNILREKTAKLGGKISPEDLDAIKKLYLDKVKEMDQHVSKLIKELDKKRGLLKDTIIVITADHGEEFYEHGGFHHEVKLYEELIHVPLIILGGGIKGKIINKVVSHIDLGPTILDLLEIKKPKEWIGKNLLLSNDEIAISEEGQEKHGDANVGSDFRLNLKTKKIAIVWRTWKYIYSEKTGTEELYDLSTDPNERNNLVGTGAADIENVLEVLRTILRNHLELLEDSHKRATISKSIANLKSKLRGNA